MQHLFQLGDGVEVHVRDEAESVAQGRRQHSGPGGGPDQGERRDLQGDRGRPRPLAHHDVDAEVLHREIEHLLGGPGHPVDLVDEEDLALRERRQDGREITRPLQRGARGDPERHGELGRDDHGKGRLAQPGPAAHQHVVRRPVAPQRALQHQRQLLAHPRLADELLQPLGPQRRLDELLVALGVRRHQIPLGTHAGPPSHTRVSVTLMRAPSAPLSLRRPSTRASGDHRSAASATISAPRRRHPRHAQSPAIRREAPGDFQAWASGVIGRPHRRSPPVTGHSARGARP